MTDCKNLELARQWAEWEAECVDCESKFDGGWQADCPECGSSNTEWSNTDDR